MSLSKLFKAASKKVNKGFIETITVSPRDFVQLLRVAGKTDDEIAEILEQAEKEKHVKTPDPVIPDSE